MSQRLFARISVAVLLSSAALHGAAMAELSKAQAGRFQQKLAQIEPR